jgi:malonyl-CoA decarboxylase
MDTTDLPATVSAKSGRRPLLERIWTSVADRGRAFADVLQPKPPKPLLEEATDLANALLSERGEASGAAVARELHETIRDMSGDERMAFFRFLSENFAPAEDVLRAAAKAYLDNPTAERAATLAEAAEPPRQELLRRMNLAAGGTASLVAMRKEILGHVARDKTLRPLDSDLRHLFASWFNRGFLELRRIDWQTPAAALEKLIAYEAVHEINGWNDLRRRLDADRRCFAFFHPSLPGEPLIFVEVALTAGLAAAVQPLLAPAGEEVAVQEALADTAIFYSISNCQDGLRGVSFGNFLIKQVVEELMAELPYIRQYSTLSPIPGFRRWLDKRIQDGEEAALPGLERDKWWEVPELAEALREPLTRLCAVYLTSPSERGGPRDPVARFHLGNGAQLERINWLGNTAPRGINESYGLMVNYLYDLKRLDKHRRDLNQGIIPTSAAVQDLFF